MNDRYAEFLNELTELLRKYHAELTITFDSKMYSIATVSFEDPYEEYELPSYIDGTTSYIE